MEQQARNATMEEWGFLRDCRYLLHDRDTKFCRSFRELIESGNVDAIRLPARSPVEADSVRGRFAAAGVAAICGALP
jgi:hypothetical protein